METQEVKHKGNNKNNFTNNQLFLNLVNEEMSVGKTYSEIMILPNLIIYYSVTNMATTIEPKRKTKR